MHPRCDNNMSVKKKKLVPSVNQPMIRSPIVGYLIVDANVHVKTPASWFGINKSATKAKAQRKNLEAKAIRINFCLIKSIHSGLKDKLKSVVSNANYNVSQNQKMKMNNSNKIK